MSVNGFNFNLFKYADHMAFVGLFYHNVYCSDYSVHVANLEPWCEARSLLNNAGKTKKLILF